VAAEIVMIVEDQNTGLWSDRASVEPRRGETADAAADNDQIVALLGRQIFNRKGCALARESVRGFKRTRMITAQPGQGRWIAGGLREDLRRRRQAGCDGKGNTVSMARPDNRNQALGNRQSPTPDARFLIPDHGT